MHSLVMLADIGGLFLFALGLCALAFWLWMIVDCARNETGSTMVTWLLVILFAGAIAAPLYFFLRRLPRRQQRLRFQLAPHLYEPWEKDQRIGGPLTKRKVRRGKPPPNDLPPSNPAEREAVPSPAFHS